MPVGAFSQGSVYKKAIFPRVHLDIQVGTTSTRVKELKGATAGLPAELLKVWAGIFGTIGHKPQRRSMNSTESCISHDHYRYGHGLWSKSRQEQEGSPGRQSESAQYLQPSEASTQHCPPF